MNPMIVTTCGGMCSLICTASYSHLYSIIYLFKSNISTGLKISTSLSETVEFPFMNRSCILQLRAKLQQLTVQSPNSDLCKKQNRKSA